MPRLLLIRHGETDWNRSGQVMGDQPIPLNPNGEQQARACAELLALTPITEIFTSPVLRAAQTADILALAHAPRPRHLAGLRESESAIGSIAIGRTSLRIRLSETGIPTRTGPDHPAVKRCGKFRNGR